MKIKLLLILLLISQFGFSQQEISLYDDKPAGSELWDWTEQVSENNIWNTRLVYNVVEPSITAFIPPYYLATGTSVIIAPGGGLHALSIDSEGIEFAKWLSSKGVAAFVLKYRLVKCEMDDPGKEFMVKKTVYEDAARVAPLAMADALTAVKYLREHAEEFDLDPAKIGFAGFSAGGALTMNVAYNASEDNRPNFIAPIYPWDVGQIVNQVPKDTMPMFLAVALDDPLDLAQHSLDIYQKWISAKQPAELHVYERGGHGFGMRPIDLPTGKWYERFGEWMHMQGYLKKLNPNKYEIQYGQDAVAQGKIDQVKQMQNDYALLSRYRSANESLPAPKPNENRVVFLGNSITDAWPFIDSSFFAENNFVGRGISGQTSPQLLLRFRKDVIELNPKVVVISIGTNDVAENTGPYDPDYTISNIASMVDLAKANNIKPILAGVVPSTKFEWNRKLGDRSDMIVDLNNRIAALAKRKGIPFADYHSAMKNSANGMDPDIAEDGVHPTAKGYEIMKGLVLPLIKETLK